MANRVCERMIKFDGKYITCRVWVTANQDFQVNVNEINAVMSTFRLTQATEDNMKMIICEIEKLKNIAAAEVLDKNGNGLLLYPDWN